MLWKHVLLRTKSLQYFLEDRIYHGLYLQKKDKKLPHSHIIILNEPEEYYTKE